MKKVLTIVCCLLSVFCCPISFAQTTLFSTEGSPVPYRIPAITTAKDGHLIAVSDYRHCGADIGFGRVDLHYRLSADNGATWGKELTLVEGDGIKGSVRCGYGDAALVADAKSHTVLLICVTGNTVYGHATTTRQNPNRMARMYSYDDGRTWQTPEEITEQIYGLFDQSELGPVQSLFFGSGRICQSRIVKVGSHYRLYAALCARPGGNRVIYSDDLGQTWHALGDIHTSPAPKGDEPKCEELPDGSVVLSSRAWGGRHFNVFHYAKKPSRKAPAEGSWDKWADSGQQADGVIAKENACNGEIQLLRVRRASDNKKVWLLLQSVPFGPKRTNVGLFYKEIPAHTTLSAHDIATGWTRGLQVSHKNSGYSPLTLQHDGRIGFYWEEESKADNGYQMDYKSLSVKEITSGKYYK